MGVGKCQTAAATPAEPGDLPRWVRESSDSGVELEQAAESVATANGSALRRYVGREGRGEDCLYPGGSVQKGDDIEYSAGLSANPADACRTETR